MKSENMLSRRQFIKSAAIAGTSLAAANQLVGCSRNAGVAKTRMKFGLVTYQWGRDWDLPTLIKNCQLAGYQGVELRTNHAHGVEPSLTAPERAEVKQRFADSPVACLGYGSNQEYHSPDPVELRTQIDTTFELIELCHDIGASGLKVKPNTLPEEVPAEKTIAQIAESLNIVGTYAQDYDQEIRVEVHGEKTQAPKVMRAIFDQVDAPNVKICWNCNDQDLEEPGLEYNFNLLKPDFGATAHIRELKVGDYPYQELFDLFVGMHYDGWILLEARTSPADRIGAMIEQREIFEHMAASSKERLG